MDPHNWHPDDNYRFDGLMGPGNEPLGEGLNMSECFLIVKLYEWIWCLELWLFCFYTWSRSSFLGISLTASLGENEM